MATMEASFPALEASDNARKRYPFTGHVHIQDISAESTVVVNIGGDSNMVRLLSDEFSIAHRMSFRALKRGHLKRNGLEVDRTPISGRRVRFQSMAQGDELSLSV